MGRRIPWRQVPERVRSVPRLLDVHDDGEWVALVFEDVEGSHSEIRWRADQLDRVAAAIADLGAGEPGGWT